MNTGEYRAKMDNMVSDTDTYMTLNKDPTGKYKNKLINKLKGWK